MHLKRTFLLSVVVGLASVTQVLPYAGGPDPGVNGVFGASNNCTNGCHNEFGVNSGTGSVTITGLPTSWVPGQMYSLAVTVTGGAIYGFQLSSVFDSTNQQAGNLTKPSVPPPNTGAVQVNICGTGFEQPLFPGACTPGAIQFAEHSAATGRNTFQVNWTAPGTSAGGRVRFNVAGNAANGDGTNQGDHIYTKIYTVDPAVVVDLSVHAFTMVDRGGVSVITDGSGSVVGGYARILAAAGSTTPSGVAIFGERAGGFLVTEAGVPASPLVKNGRIYAEVGPGGNAALGSTIGLAIVNPDAVATANIGFTLTDTTGTAVVTGTYNLGPGQKKASFLDEDPWFVPFGFRGTFTFNSNIGISVVALLGYRNERVPADFLITTLPVINTDTYTPGTAAALVPYFTDGVGWNTTILLVNPTDTAMSGTIQFHQIDGSIKSISANGTVSATASFPYTISPRSAFRLKTDGVGTFQNGSVTITPGSATNTPVPLAAFGSMKNGITTTQSGVPSNSGTAFRTFVEGIPGAPTSTIGSYSSGIAIGNSTGSPVTATLNLYSTLGAPVATTTVPVAKNGVTAKFIDELFPSVVLPFQGVLEITCASPISVVGLRIRYNERDDLLLTTIPPTDENSNTTTDESDFPHILNGGGYTTEFILFSGALNQASSGNLKFLNPDGSNLNLTVN
jgi:hypothetical protein